MKKISHINQQTFHSFHLILEALENDSTELLSGELANLHPADIADLYEDLGAAHREKLLSVAANAIDADVLRHLEELYKSEVIKRLGANHFKRSLNALKNEDLIELIESLSPHDQMNFTNIIRNTRKDALNLLTKYGEDSIGRNMSLNFLLIPHSWTVEKALAYIKSQDELSENCSEVFIANDSLNPVGSIPIATLIATEKKELVKNIANYDVVTVNANLDQEKAYALFNKYHFQHIPVVENSGRMVGILRAEEILRIVEEETTEDYLKLGGLPKEEADGPFWRSCFIRLRWLSVSVLNALFSPLIIYLFQDSIQHIISLAALMPIVGSIGGNVGVQTVSVIIKALSSERLRERKFLKIVLKEAAIGSANGFVIGIFLGILAGFWFKSAILGVVLAAAMFFCSTWAAFMGALLPIMFSKLGYDASLSSGPLVTTITDASGFIIFLGLATLFMM